MVLCSSVVRTLCDKYFLVYIASCALYWDSQLRPQAELPPIAIGQLCPRIYIWYCWYFSQGSTLQHSRLQLFMHTAIGGLYHFTMIMRDPCDESNNRSFASSNRWVPQSSVEVNIPDPSIVQKSFNRPWESTDSVSLSVRDRWSSSFTVAIQERCVMNVKMRVIMICVLDGQCQSMSVHWNNCILSLNKAYAYIYLQICEDDLLVPGGVYVL